MRYIQSVQIDYCAGFTDKLKVFERKKVELMTKAPHHRRDHPHHDRHPALEERGVPDEFCQFRTLNYRAVVISEIITVDELRWSPLSGS
jgi:hypothetical protein